MKLKFIRNNLFMVLVCLAGLFAVGPLMWLGVQLSYAAPDPKLVAGPENCGECHASEVMSWRKTKHYKGFRRLTRRGDARKIAKKMGIKRIKRESLCMNCHFTSKPKKKRPKPIAGVSCESCHGAAKNWIDVHQDFGGKGATKETETPEHRKQRLAKIKEAGMIRPVEIYRLAQNCFQCHTGKAEPAQAPGGASGGDWSRAMLSADIARYLSDKEPLQ